MVTYKIHQIKDIANTHYAFRGYDPTKFDFADYELRYGGRFPDNDKSDVEVCEAVYHLFNVERPADFTGHSLSMSDLVEVITDYSRNFYYCDWSGWTRVT
jgi:hypothetical protein